MPTLSQPEAKTAKAKTNSASSRRRRRAQIRGYTVAPKARLEVRALLGKDPCRRDLLIEYLHRIQDRYHCLSRDHLAALAEVLRLSTTEVYETASFYHHFDLPAKDAPPIPECTVRVCDSVVCQLFGAEPLAEALERAAGDSGGRFRVQRVPCVGRCAGAPVAVVGTLPLEKTSPQTVLQAVRDGQVEDSPPPGAIRYQAYQEAGGYQLLRDCRAGRRSVAQVLEELKKSGLRGLGGAGFPAARKWEILRAQEKPRLVAINIDEGEPGTFKDRYYLERDPHRFLEGTLIAAWAIEAQAAYLYLRDEYAGCRRLLEEELAALRRDPPCTPLPELHLRRGAGAYICGEESAMIESIEGKRGMPRLRPPFVAEVGLFGRPTLEHNLETLHWVRTILEDGGEKFACHGRRGRQGMRSFSVSGRVRKPGVHWAPAGISAHELIEEYCGGMLPGHELYAFFPGGASGGILPASLAKDLPLDFDTLREHDCFIGSAAIIVLSQQDSVRQAALDSMRFFAHESCGQCTPCRVGTIKAVHLMKQKQWDQPLLKELSQVMVDASICGLGQAAPNPMLCAMRYFPQEFR